MLKNYFRIALRSMLKDKAHSFINIIGLSVGMAVAILIGLWIYDELSFNKYHRNYDRIAQVMQHTTYNNERYSLIYNPYHLGDVIKSEYGSQFKYVVMSTLPGSHVLKYGNDNFMKMGNYMDAEVTEMLSLQMIRGSRPGPGDQSSILLSESLAQTIFGKTDPVGKVLKIDNQENVTVTGVYEDIPDNSDFKDLLFIAPWKLYLAMNPSLKGMSDPWSSNNWATYVQLAENVDMEKISEKMKDLRARHMKSASVALFKPIVFLHPMGKWHLFGEFKNGVNVGGKIKYVWMFGMIGVFVLVLACINFMNLSTARSERRAKEVGIRKAIGSLRGQLIGQFFCESILVAAFSFVLALALMLLVLPSFNGLAEKSMSIPWSSPVFWIAGILFSLLTGIIAGSYPALYLSSFQAVKVLKGTFRPGRSASLPRKILVVLQFTVSVVLIICTIIVFRQIQYAKDRPLGYDSDGLITTDLTPQISNHFYAIRNELKRSGVIDDMALSSNSTIDWNVDVTELYWKGKDPALSIIFPFNNVSYEYGKTIGWQIMEGRDFSPEYPSDSSAFILNQAAVRIMGFQHPIGETVEWRGRQYKVIGVIRDIIFESPYRPVNPSIFNMTGNASLVVTLRIARQTPPSKALDKISAVFNNYDPSVAFNFQFVDGQYAKRFDDEVRVGKLAGFFTILAIFISCLGLFGMASFMTERRVKEIGVRKVLGASLFSIWGLLSREFLLLVTIALLIAIPVAFLFMHGWLQNYAYHTSMSWWIFVLAALGSLLITILTVSFQAIKAALANPVKSLRSE